MLIPLPTESFNVTIFCVVWRKSSC